MRKKHQPGCPCCPATGGGTTTLPGCPCASPLTITQSVTNPSANYNIFQNATIVYGPVPPGLSALSLGANAYLSTAEFTDSLSSDKFRYRFFCSAGFFCISRVYEVSVHGSPYSDATLYRWLAGSGGNTCTPFLMVSGTIFGGGDPSTAVTLSA